MNAFLTETMQKNILKSYLSNVQEKNRLVNLFYSPFRKGDMKILYPS